MRKIFFSLIGGFFIFLISVSVVFAAVSWSETQPGGEVDFSWTPSAMSSDGQKMIVGNQGGTLYISSNKGSSWELIDPTGGAEAPNWLTTSMSSDGQTMLAGVYGVGGRLYRSTDGGSNWSEIRPAGNADFDWSTTSMSSNGQIMLAGIRNSGRLYKSTNGGSNWSEIRPAGDTDQSWGSSNMSSNGQVMVAGVINGRLYLSTNAGSNWTEIQPAGDGDEQWSSVGMSSGGQVILVGNANSLFLSTNTGSSWIEVLPAGEVDKTWPISSVSSDGETLLTGGGDRLYLSTDGGDSWPQTQPAGNVDRNWTLGSISADSQVMLAGVYNGRLYLGSNPLPNSTSSGGSSSSSSTPTCATTPNGAPNLFQINTTNKSATVYFSPVGSAQNYLISYGFDSNANQFNVFTNQGASSGVLSYTVNELPINSAVYFKIYAQNNCGQGNWSNTVQVATSGRVYFKNLTARITSYIPNQTTVLGTKTSVSSKAIPTSHPFQKEKSTSKQELKVLSEAPKKSCFLFICW